MKNILILIACATISLTGHAQGFDKLDKSVMDAAFYPAKAPKRTFAKSAAKKEGLTPKIRVLYSRPLTKGRTIFGDLLKFDKPWRIGANESTEILFLTDVQFGDTAVKAGRYSLIIIPTATTWTLKLNTENDGWGNYSYKPEKDIASITAPVKNNSKKIEALSISLYEKSTNLVHLKIGWDTSIAEFPITLQ